VADPDITANRAAFTTAEDTPAGLPDPLETDKQEYAATATTMASTLEGSARNERNRDGRTNSIEATVARACGSLAR